MLCSGGYNVPLAANPFNSWAKVLDCGDVPVTSYDPAWAIQQIEEGHNSVLMREPATNAGFPGLSKQGKTFPRVITMGGDHSITLPLLRSMNKAYGPITVIHFDSHLDTWKPHVFGGAPSKVASINHGTYFYHAAMEGLLKNDTNIHAGIRTTLSGLSDYDNDGYVGFEIVEAREIDTIGIDGIIKKIHNRVGELTGIPDCERRKLSDTPTQARILLSTFQSTSIRLIQLLLRSVGSKFVVGLF